LPVHVLNIVVLEGVCLLTDQSSNSRYHPWLVELADPESLDRICLGSWWSQGDTKDKT
jgi:hypothetical protein